MAMRTIRQLGSSIPPMRRFFLASLTLVAGSWVIEGRESRWNASIKRALSAA